MATKKKATRKAPQVTANRSLPMNQNQFAQAYMQIQDFQYTVIQDLRQLHANDQALERMLAVVNYVTTRNYWILMRMLTEAQGGAANQITVAGQAPAPAKYDYVGRKTELEAEYDVLNAFWNIGQMKRHEERQAELQKKLEEIQKKAEEEGGLSDDAMEEAQALIAEAESDTVPEESPGEAVQ